MPSRNVLKIDVGDCYFHAYARGSNRQPIFLDASDFGYFLSLFARYLSHTPVLNQNGVPYSKLYNQIELLAYCLMQNHFHLLFYQVEAGAMTRLMRGIMTAYSRYFNHKYNRSGSLCESRYKASIISSEPYLLHISRYVHLNPDDWQNYPYSSIRHFTLGDEPDWLLPNRILDLFKSRGDYMKFISDYKEIRDTLENIKHWVN